MPYNRHVCNNTIISTRDKPTVILFVPRLPRGFVQSVYLVYRYIHYREDCSRLILRVKSD